MTLAPCRSDVRFALRQALPSLLLPCLAMPLALALGCGGHSSGTNVPTVASFTPAQGVSGATVVVTGTEFTNVVSMNIDGINIPTYTINSDEQITFQVPPAAITGPVTVGRIGNVVGTSTTNFTVMPQITGITPVTGTAATSLALGTQVLITGTGLVGTTYVAFGNEPAGGAGSPFTVLSATQVSATVGVNGATGPVTLTASGLTCAGPTFTVTP